MFAWGSKYFFALSLAGLVGAVVYGIASGGDIVGVISSGYKGGVGDHFGYSLLLGAGLVSACLGILSVIIRDADIDPDVAINTAATIAPPSTPSYWGALGAVGVACVALGLSISSIFLYLGLAILFVVALEWLVLAWSDRATGDAASNRVIRDRVLGPFEVPMFSMLAIAAGVVGGSRIFLAVPHVAATAIASGFSAIVFFAAVYLAKSNPSRATFVSVVSVLALAVLGGGVAAAVVGEYDHHGSHGEEHSSEGHEEDHGEESHDESGEKEPEASMDDSVSEEN